MQAGLCLAEHFDQEGLSMTEKGRFGLICVWGIFLVALIVPCASRAQITFERTYGGTDRDDAKSVQQTLDGGYILAGTTESFGLGVRDVYLVKTDSLGNIVWERTYGSTVGDNGFSVQQTLDGGYVVVGWSGAGGGSEDVYLVKTDSLGNMLWEMLYGGSLEDRGFSVQQTLDGGYIVTGWKFSGGMPVDVYLVKTDSLGSVLWERTYGYGTNPVQWAHDVQQTSDGGYIIAGTTTSGVVMDSHNVYVIKTNPLGNVVWERTYGGSYEDDANSVRQTSDGGYIITGATQSFRPDTADVYLIKIDFLGNILWETTPGSGFSGWSVRQTPDGGYIIAGSTTSLGAGATAVYLVKTDFLGNALWDRAYGGSSWDYGYSGHQTLDGGYVVAGWTRSFGAGGDDVYLIKTDTLGQVVGIEEESSRFNVQGSRFELLQNAPNPFHGGTVIGYSLPVAGSVTLEVYDITGRLVETLVNKRQERGSFQVQWDSKDNSSGIYFYRLHAGEFRDTKKMILVRK